MRAKLLKIHYPQIFEQLDFKKSLEADASLTKEKLENILVGDLNRNIWWTCPVAEDHSWQGNVANRVTSYKKRGIIVCRFCPEAKSGRLKPIIWLLNTKLPSNGITKKLVKAGRRFAGSQRNFTGICTINSSHQWPQK